MLALSAVLAMSTACLTATSSGYLTFTDEVSNNRGVRVHYEVRTLSAVVSAVEKKLALPPHVGPFLPPPPPAAGEGYSHWALGTSRLSRSRTRNEAWAAGADMLERK